MRTVLSSAAVAATIVVMVAVKAPTFGAAGGRLYALKSVEAGGAPAIENKTLRYTMDLVFAGRPPNCWWYSKPGSKLIVIDCYGGHVGKPGRVRISPTSPFKGLQVVNRTTKLSLNGRQALIRIPLDPGWEASAESVDSTLLRVSAWKAVEGPKPRSVPRPHIPIIVIGGALAAAVTVLLIVGSN